MAETAKQAKDYAMQKAVEAKDTVSSAGETTVQYTRDKAIEAKDSAVDAGKTASGYVAEKAPMAKDTTVETVKSAAGSTKDTLAGAGEHLDYRHCFIYPVICMLLS